MDIVKKFQLVLYGETVEVFDRLFDIAEEEDPEARYYLCGSLMEFMLADYMLSDVVRVTGAAGSISKLETREERFNVAKSFIKQLITEEVQNYILQRENSEDCCFELLKEE